MSVPLDTLANGSACEAFRKGKREIKKQEEEVEKSFIYVSGLHGRVKGWNKSDRSVDQGP